MRNVKLPTEPHGESRDVGSLQKVSIQLPKDSGVVQATSSITVQFHLDSCPGLWGSKAYIDSLTHAASLRL